MNFPSPIENLIKDFSNLPGIGPRAARRIVFFLLNQSSDFIKKFSQDFISIKKDVFLCPICFGFTDQKNQPCPICRDHKRDQQTICVVENILDILPIEKTGQYQGVYHILGGTINLSEGITPQKLKIKELFQRAQKAKEIILALNPTIEGDTTALYLEKVLQKTPVKITKLARGISTGSLLEYTDEGTLSQAIKNRK
ncbi:MAG TPA: recombination protein RecR [Candidatus Portnoybacteria bacterium]|nr:recombination protein RecR [Candidatus Portnoybacteria bacterium]